MKINFNSNKAINDNLSSQNQCKTQAQISFGSAKARKLIEKIKNATNINKFSATFEDVVAVYEELGYDVILKRGSHAVIPLGENLNMPLVMPHGSKYVHSLDLKRLRYVINGEIEKAAKVQ